MKIAIIPARGGSQRIKNKNIVDFFGKPMIAYALEAVQKSQLFDKIHVSTDSQEIKNVVENLGYKIDFMRDSALADNMTGIAPVLKWVLERYEHQGESYEDICCVMPASPLLEADDLVASYQTFIQKGKKYPLLATASLPVPAEWVFHRYGDGILSPVSQESLLCRSQDLKPAYYESGPFSYFHASHLLNEEVDVERKFISYVIPQERAVDIDDEKDLQFAKILFLGRLAQKNSKETCS